jgi:hypothetical protein
VALLLTVRFAEKLVAEVGVKTTEAVQEAPTARLLPQVFVSVKPVPAVIDEIVAVELPVFFRATVCGTEDDPTDTVPKASEVTEAVIVAGDIVEMVYAAVATALLL